MNNVVFNGILILITIFVSCFIDINFVNILLILITLDIAQIVDLLKKGSKK